MKAKKWVLVKHFQGEPKDEDIQLQEEELPAVKEGEFLAEALYLSVDPYMRAYMARFPPNRIMIGQQYAQVKESKNADYPVGSHVLLNVGWRSHTVVDPREVPGATGMSIVLKPPSIDPLPGSLTLGSLGMPGMTAYCGLLKLCKPQTGETVLVSGAAGAVGSLVGQIAKVKGCKVIGFAGSDDKVAWLKELGFDHAYNYKTADISQSLSEAAPDGIDCYFDNVGGDFSNIVLTKHMKLYGRVALCGCISRYNDTTPPQGPELYSSLLQKQVTISGFIVSRWYSEYKQNMAEMAQWIIEGKVKYREHVTSGFENMRAAFYGLLKGANTGKAIVKV